MLTPNSRPARPQPAAFAEAEGNRAPPPQSRRSPSRSIAASPPSSLSARPRKPESATSRFEPEPTTPSASPASAAQESSPSSSASVRGRANQSALPAGADGRQPGEREIAFDSGRRRNHRFPCSFSVNIDAKAQRGLICRLPRPRPRQAEDVAGADRDQDLILDADGTVPVQEARERGVGFPAVGQPENTPPAHPLRSGLGDLQAADAGQLANRLLARRVDVEHDGFVGQRQGGAEAARQKPWCASRGGAGRRRSAVRDPARAGPRGRRGPRSGDGRSRHICGCPCASPSARGAAARRGSRASAAAARLEFEAGKLERRERRAGVEQVVTSRHRKRHLRGSGGAGIEDRNPPALAQVGEAALRRDRDAVGGTDEAAKCRPQLGHRSPAAVVVHLDVGDDRDLRPQLEEAGVALVGLGDDPLAPAPARVYGASGARAPEPRRRRRRRDRRRARAAPRPASPSSSSCRGCRRPRSGASRRRAGRAGRRGGPARRRAREPGPARGCRRRSRSRRRPRRPRAGWRRRDRPPDRAPPPAAAPYKRSRLGRCR